MRCAAFVERTVEPTARGVAILPNRCPEVGRASRTLLAGPALSLRRLELDHGTYDVAIVSPKDRDGFVAALVARNPAIDVRDA